uniref:Uncharacterized protein n=1 Tax=Mesocestoides corti TaxID=53468 RepID=A0A5K3F159_MESCO
SVIRSIRLRYTAPLLAAWRQPRKSSTPPFIHTYMYLRLTSHLDLDVSTVMTHASEV